jgi:DNA polymerase III subunit delta
VPLYIYYGAEALARREAFARLRGELDSDGALATNTVTFDATATTPEEVIAACDTVPFLGDRRLVVVEGLLATAGRKRAAKKPAPGEEEPPSPWLALVDYVDRMPASTVLMLIDDEAPKTGLLKDLGPKGTVESFAPVHEKALPAWVMERAKSMGVKIDPAAAKLLGDLVGPSSEGGRRRKTQGHMMLLASELDKLAAYANGEVIREKDVRALVSRAKEHKGWDLTDAIMRGQRATAAKVLQEQIEDGQVLAVILSTVAGRYRRVAIAKDMVESGATGGEIASQLGMKQGYGVDKLIEEARRMSWDDIRAAYRRLIEADLDVKRLGMDEQIALEMAVEELASRSARHPVRSR